MEIENCFVSFFFLLITTRNIRYFIIEILISIFHTVKIILSFLEFKFVLKSKFLLALRPYLKSSFLFSQLKMAAIHETDAKIIHDSDFNRY